jgi:molybdopterin adenylyltransferase
MRAAVITLSTTVAAGFGRDESGPRLRDLARLLGADDVKAEVMPDDRERLEAALRHWADREGCSLILTSGGTGFAPTDHTPEATRAVIERDAPGFAEAMRIEGARHTPLGILTRGVSGIAGRTLIVNFPGNPKAIDQLFPVLAPTLKHAAETLRR